MSAGDDLATKVENVVDRAIAEIDRLRKLVARHEARLLDIYDFALDKVDTEDCDDGSVRGNDWSHVCSLTGVME